MISKRLVLILLVLLSGMFMTAGITLASNAPFAKKVMICDCGSLPSDVVMTQISIGDPVVNFTDMGEGGLPPNEHTIANPVLYHQPDIDFNEYYIDNKINGPCDLWPSTE